jgi:hypothetical protein
MASRVSPLGGLRAYVALLARLLVVGGILAACLLFPLVAARRSGGVRGVPRYAARDTPILKKGIPIKINRCCRQTPIKTKNGIELFISIIATTAISDTNFTEFQMWKFSMFSISFQECS